MEKLSVDNVDQTERASDADRRELTDPLGASDVAVNRFALEPGESLSGLFHTHLDQEEVFYVIDGEVTFEAAPDPDAETETVIVGRDEIIRFAPGEYQEGRNESDEEAVALALGAPKGSTEVRVAQGCPSCDSPAMDIGMGESGIIMECPDCSETVQPDF